MLPKLWSCDAGTLVDTQRFAVMLALIALAGDCICLSGALGAGKTAFARAFVRSLTSAEEDVPSPTFTLVQPYDGKSSDGCGVRVWHYDLCRLNHAGELEELALEEALADITLIEWPEIASDFLPDTRLELHFSLAGGEEARHIDWYGASEWKQRLLKVIAENV